jgi:hypothetical protein
LEDSPKNRQGQRHAGATGKLDLRIFEMRDSLKNWQAGMLRLTQAESWELRIFELEGLTAKNQAGPDAREEQHTWRKASYFLRWRDLACKIRAEVDARPRSKQQESWAYFFERPLC